MKTYNIPKVTIKVVPSKFRKEKIVRTAVDVGEAIRTNTLGRIDSSLLRRGMAENTAECPDYIAKFGIVEDEIVDEKTE